MGDFKARIMANFDEIDEARRVLGLNEGATLKQVKIVYRRLAHKYHPDICKKPECQEMMVKVNRAFTLVVQYFSDYCYVFDEDAVERAYPYDEYLRKWKNAWRF